MRAFLFRLSAAIAILALVVAPVGATVSAQGSPVGTNVPQPRPNRAGLGPDDLEEVTASPVALPASYGLSKGDIQKIYGALGDQDVIVIVELTEPNVVDYAADVVQIGGVGSKDGQQFNAHTPEAQAYISHLVTQQDQFEAATAQVIPNVTRVASYVAAMNGVALKLPASQVAKLSQQPGVKAIFENKVEHLDTDVGPTWIGAPAIWAQLGGQELAGDGIVIADIDSGAWSPNPITPTETYSTPQPSFASDASVAGGAYAFPFTSVTGISFTDHLGVCKTVSPQPSDGTFICTDKLIGGYWYNAGGIANAGERHSPLDEDGHGTHTASTAGGNVVTVTVGASQLKISGVAPRARIIAYKVCWDADPTLPPPDGGCSQADSVSAINQAILDGVNAINFSISGGTTFDAVELAFLNARAAGIFVSASAGNDGPTAGTANHLSPWLNTSAAMQHDRDFRSSLVLTSTYTLSMPTDLEGSSITAGYTSTIILAPLQGTETVLPSLCQQPYAPATFSGEIVVCRRGVNARLEKSANVAAGGAGGFVLVNAANNQGLVPDEHPIPAVHLEKNATAFSQPGEDLVTYLQAAALASATVTASITGGAPAPKQGDVMAAFSSRGPGGANLIKPDNAAPGVAILAGNSQAHWDDFQPDGGLYHFSDGTSMSSPHTTGAGALLKALHPDWTAAQIQSALMTGGVEIVKEDGTTPGDPFDYGSGRIDLSHSESPGLTFDIPITDYFLVVSGTKAIETLNYPSGANISCVASCSWERTAENVMTTTATYTWNVVSATPGLTVTLDQPSYTVAAGATANFTVTANVLSLPNDGEYAFARVELHETTTGRIVAFPVAVIATFGTLPAAIEINTRRNAGSQLLPDVTALEITDLTIRSYGLTQAGLTTQALAQDPTTNNAYDNLSNGVMWISVTVPAGAKRLVAEITDSTSNDIDLFVGLDQDADGPEESEEVDTSATGAVLEYVSIDDPDPGLYWVLVENFDNALPADPTTLAVGVVPNTDSGNLDVTGPMTVTALAPFDLRVFWDTPTMVAGDRWYGAFDVGTDSGNPGNIGIVAVDIVRDEDDVVKTVSKTTATPGTIVTYTITIQPNITPEDLTYTLTDTIPAGLTYISGTVTGGAVVSGTTVTWSGLMEAAGGPLYVMTTSDDDPDNCGVPLANSGAYTNMRGYGFSPSASFTGDTVAYQVFTGGTPFEYYATNHNGIIFQDDGFARFSIPGGGETPWVNTDLPDPAAPNDILAMMWRDMEFIYATSPISRGVTAITLGGTGPFSGGLLEFDDVQLFDDPSVTLDYELFMWRTSDTSTSPEIIFAYDNISGTLDFGTVGVENVDGTAATKFAFDDAPLGDIHNGMAICFDWHVPAPAAQVITYQAMVDVGTEGQTLTNDVEHMVDNPGAKEAETSTDLFVADYGVTSTPPTDAKAGLPGSVVSYTLTVTNTGNLTDTFTVSKTVTGAAFTTTVPSSLGPLGAGISTTVQVSVTIPPGALGTASSQATIKFTSQGDGVTNDTSVLTTTVLPVYGVISTPPTASLPANPGQTVTYTLAVTNTGNLTDTFDVSSTVTGGSFTTTVGNPVGPLGPGAGTTIQVVVNVPPGASSGASSQATVTFTSQGNGSASDSSVLTTTVGPVYGVTVTPPTDAQSGVPGQTMTYTLSVTNTGNITDTFSISKITAGGAFNTNAPSTVGPLGPGANAAVLVNVIIPGGAASGSFSQATITFVSVGQFSVTESSLLTTTVLTVYGVTSTPPTDGLSADPGQSVTYTLSVTNTGNLTDTFTVSSTVTGGAFTTTVGSTVGPLGPGASTTVQVVVTVPPGAADGTSSQATITFTSQGNGSASDSSVLTTTVGLVYGVISTPPTASQSAVPGQMVTYTLRVTNTGNATDTFNISQLISGGAFTTTAPATVGPLAPGAGANVQVVVNVPAGSASGASSQATITFTSQGNGSVSDSSVLTTSTSAVYDVVVAPLTDGQSLLPGQSAVYTLSVTNAGNITDTFNVSKLVTGGAFTTTAPSTVGPLAPGATVLVQVVVTIPPGTANGTSSQATITFTSQGNGSVSDSSVLTTTSAWKQLRLPFVVWQP